MSRNLALSVLFLLPFFTKAQSVLWEISGNNLKKKSYVFGTIHIQDKRVFQFDEVVYKKLKSCKTFAMEIAPDASNMAKIAQGMLLEKGKTLKDIYTPEEYQLIADTLLKYTGMPIILFNKMKPIALSSMIMSTQIKSEMEEALDIHLYHYAQIKKLETQSIETVDEQIKAMETITPEYVLESFKTVGKGHDTFDKLLDFYLTAQLDSLQKLLLEDDGQGFETEELLDKRNLRMADRIAAMAQEKPVFAAIGAGHLYGEQGVLELLRKQGYTLTPIPFKYNTEN